MRARYALSDSSWTPETDMGYFVELASEFYEAAEREGIAIHNDSQTILLQEALEGGWR